MSKLLTVNALILKASDYADNDRFISLLSAEKGRIQVLAKGARSVKYKYLAEVQQFCYGTYVLYEKNGIYWLKEAQSVSFFPEITENIEKFALSSYLAELCCELSDENVPADELMRLLLNCFYMIANDKRPPKFIKAVFEFRAMCISGYAPDLSGCRGCGTSHADMYYFDVMNGSLLCPVCFSSEKSTADAGQTFDGILQNVSDIINDLGERATYLPVDGTVAASLKYLTEAEPSKIFAFDISGEDDRYDFFRLTEVYTLWHLGKNFNSLGFFKSFSN